MRKKSHFLIPIILFLIVSCSDSEIKAEKQRPLVYEGMSSAELIDVLGEPLEIDTSGFVFDARTMKKGPVIRYRFEKRAVLLINDTVKNPNE